jgi:hypothetical protein
MVEIASGDVVGTMVLRNVGPPQIANLGTACFRAIADAATSRAFDS